MFRKKKSPEPRLSPEEAQRLVQNVTAPPQYPTQQMIPQQPIQQPQIQQQPQYVQRQPTSEKKTDYFITKKDVVREKQTMVTQSNQVIETGQEITRQVARDLYQITQDDLVAIIQNVPTSEPIHRLALKMLTGNM